MTVATDTKIEALDDRAAAGHVMLSVNASWNVFNFRMSLLRRLMSEGFRITIVAPEDAYSQRLVEAGCVFEPITINSKNTSPTQDIALFKAYRRLIRQHRPDVYLGYTAKPNIYGGLAAQLSGVPVINNVSGLGTAFIRRNWVTFVIKWLYRIGLFRSFRVFFQNADDLNLFRKAYLVRARAGALLPGSGVDLNRFQPTVLPNTDGTSLRFLMICRLLRDKGAYEYVEAARLVKARYPGATFGVLGFLDVDNSTAISRAEVDQWQAEGLINYLGVTDDVRPFIADADCVVLPSYREGTPKTLLEAAAMARPLITTDVPGCREVIDGGRNGYLCDVRSADSLAARMVDLIEVSQATRQGMADASRAMVEARFDEKIVHDLYLQAIREALVR